jgi:hypothetical protein
MPIKEMRGNTMALTLGDESNRKEANVLPFGGLPLD